jgi:hypothetical protein
MGIPSRGLHESIEELREKTAGAPKAGSQPEQLPSLKFPRALSDAVGSITLISKDKSITFTGIPA